jgi:hypothetical protein
MSCGGDNPRFFPWPVEKTREKLKEIGKKAGLKEDNLFYFVHFFMLRFPGEMDTQYMQVWAERFKKKIECLFADNESMYILEILRPFVSLKDIFRKGKND